MSASFNMKDLQDSLNESRQMHDVEMKLKRRPSPIHFDLEGSPVKKEKDLEKTVGFDLENNIFYEDRDGNTVCTSVTKGVERKWTKHVYKSGQMSHDEKRKLLFGDSGKNNRRGFQNQRKNSSKMPSIRGGKIQHRLGNRFGGGSSDVQTKQYFKKLSNLYFFNDKIKKSFAVEVDDDDNRFVQVSVSTKNRQF